MNIFLMLWYAHAKDPLPKYQPLPTYAAACKILNLGNKGNAKNTLEENLRLLNE